MVDLCALQYDQCAMILGEDSVAGDIVGEVVGGGEGAVVRFCELALLAIQLARRGAQGVRIVGEGS